jgi:nucleotidyltransferase substrate binding protein (TIGR01987 family)
MVLDFSQLKLAILNLQKQYVNFCSLSPDLQEITQEAVKESIIQRFEICYDILWKILRKHLIKEFGIADIPNSPKPVFRIASENKILCVVEQWLAYAELRTETTHEYGVEILQKAIGEMKSFIEDVIKLYEKISGEKWQE